MIAKCIFHPVTWPPNRLEIVRLCICRRMILPEYFTHTSCARQVTQAREIEQQNTTSSTEGAGKGNRTTRLTSSTEGAGKGNRTTRLTSSTEEQIEQPG